MKSEPLVYPWKNLVEDKKTHWDGVRNYQARNMMRDDMKLGDRVLFYHSNFKPPHVVGVAEICKEGTPIIPHKILHQIIMMKKQLLKTLDG